MTLKDELDYTKESRRDLTVRLMGAQAFALFLLKAYSALRSHGVDFMKLPEWVSVEADIDKARKLKPDAAESTIIGIFARLESALSAAIRRKQFKLWTNGPQPEA